MRIARSPRSSDALLTFHRARAEAEDYKNKYITTKTNLKRYAEKFETWLESIKKAKQEKKRDSSSSVVIDVESDSFDLAPVSPLPPAEKKSATNGKDVAGKREKATRESTSSSTDQRAAKRKFSTTPSKTTLRGELAAEFPADTPPDEPALLTRSITTTSSASTCGPTPPVPTQTQTPTQPAPFKYVEVVRKRAERDMLPAAECEQCKQVRSRSDKVCDTSCTNRCFVYSFWTRSPMAPRRWIGVHSSTCAPATAHASSGRPRRRVFGI